MQLNGHATAVLWFTGLSGSGKSTLAGRVEARLHTDYSAHTYLLDGDALRAGLNGDLGFDAASRAENIRRAGEVARLLFDAGLIVLTAFISPFRVDRERARALFPAGAFFEIYLDCPLAVCEQRDPKGLYRQARAGLRRDFTGLDSPYEPPSAPELALDTSRLSVAESVAEVVQLLERQDFVVRRPAHGAA